MRERYGRDSQHKGDPTKCSASVTVDWNSHQCSRAGTIEEDGELWCKTHAPSSIKAKDEKATAEWKAKSEARKAAQPAAVRRAAIEEAAKVAEDYVGDQDLARYEVGQLAYNVAAEIRALLEGD